VQESSRLFRPWWCMKNQGSIFIIRNERFFVDIHKIIKIIVSCDVFDYGRIFKRREFSIDLYNDTHYSQVLIAFELYGLFTFTSRSLESTFCF